MGKTRIIAETGAGDGVATATVCALMNMPCVVYMGRTDVERQQANVRKMEMLGATVVPVTSGNMTLKDATNEGHPRLVLPPRGYVHHRFDGGPHPYPDMVARLQSVISEEIRVQLRRRRGARLSRLPDGLRRRRAATPRGPSITTWATSA